MSKAAFGWTNYVNATGAGFYASSQAANMGPTNLQTDQGSPAVAWQTAAGVKSGIVLQVSIPTAAPWRAVGLFRTNLTPAAKVTCTLFNGGVGVAAAGPAAPVVSYGQVVLLFPADTVATIASINIDDPTNPDGFVNVPLAFAGPLWFPLIGPAWENTATGRDDQTDEVVSRGGQEYPIMRWQRRRQVVALSGATESEVWNDIDVLDSAARLGGNVLYIPDVTSAYLQRAAIYGRLKATADVTYPYGGADARAWQATLTERV